jgi:hypothetical protein
MRRRRSFRPDPDPAKREEDRKSLTVRAKADKLSQFWEVGLYEAPDS